MYSKIRQSHICITEVNGTVRAISFKYKGRTKWNLQTLR